MRSMTAPTPPASPGAWPLAGLRIVTARLLLTAIDDAACAALLRLLADLRVHGPYYLDPAPPPGLEVLGPTWRESCHRVPTIVAREFDGAGEGGRVVGCVQFNGADLGFFVDPAFWRCGYGREMVLACCACVPQRLGLQRLHASLWRENLASRRILEVAGFVFEGLGNAPWGRAGSRVLLRYRWLRSCSPCRPPGDGRCAG
jgi:RimJ/RimL family protein N-acetyltransferase